MNRTLVAFSLLLPLFSLSGQEVIVLCEGAQDFTSGEVLEAPRLGRFHAGDEDPEFEVLHVFEGHAFAVDVVLDETGTEAFVSAEDTVYRIDALSGEVLAQQALEGARRLMLYGDRVFVTRGDYDPETFGAVVFDAYVVALDAETLAWEGDWSAVTGEGPAFSTEAMAVVDGVLHVGINHAFAWGEEVGLVGRLDLETGGYTEVDLGPEGLNPVHLLNMGDAVVTVNARQYEATSLSRVEPGTDAVTLTVAATTAGCGAAVRLGDEVMFQVYGEGQFRIADPVNLTESGTWAGNGEAVYSMAVTEDDRILLGTTNFTTSGAVDILSPEGEILAMVETGVAPGRLVVVPEVNAVGTTPDGVQGLRSERFRVDMLGRPVSADRAGLHILHFEDGSVRKVFRLAD